MKLPEVFFPFLGNWVDVVVIALALFSLWEGWRRGFITLTFELCSLIVAYFSALFSYWLPGNILRTSFAFPHGLAFSLSFAVIAIFMQQLTSFLLGNLEDKIPPKYHRNKWNLWFSIFPLIGNYLMTVVLVMTILIGLPYRKDFKQAVINSSTAEFVMKQSFIFEKKFYGLFNFKQINTYSFSSVSFLARDAINLQFKTNDFETDTKSESKLLQMINVLRSESTKLFKPDTVLQNMANQHAKDMLFQQQLVHETDLPFEDKLRNSGAKFSHAAQLVAFSPTETLVYQGFMENLESKEYLLSSLYTKIGISAVDTGVFGKVFVIILTD